MSGALSSAACGTGNSTVSAGSGTFDYTDVRALVTAVTGQILGLSLEPLPMRRYAR
jgi:hypothetical protein